MWGETKPGTYRGWERAGRGLRAREAGRRCEVHGLRDGGVTPLIKTERKKKEKKTTGEFGRSGKKYTWLFVRGARVPGRPTRADWAGL